MESQFAAAGFVSLLPISSMTASANSEVPGLATDIPSQLFRMAVDSFERVANLGGGLVFAQMS